MAGQAGQVSCFYGQYRERLLNGYLAVLNGYLAVYHGQSQSPAAHHHNEVGEYIPWQVAVTELLNGQT